MQLLKDLIDVKVAKKGNMSLINGINYGCQYEGYYDHPIIFFTSIGSHFFNEGKTSKEKCNEFIQTVSQIKQDE